MTRTFGLLDEIDGSFIRCYTRRLLSWDPDNKCEVTAAKDKCGEMPLEVSDSLVSLSSSSLFRVVSLPDACHSFQTAPDIARVTSRKLLHSSRLKNIRKLERLLSATMWQ